MKKLLLSFTLSVVLFSCKDKQQIIKAPITQEYKLDTVGYITMIAGTQYTTDRDGKVRDSSLHERYYINNYKPVPEYGVVYDTAYYKDDNTTITTYMTFYNQLRVFQMDVYVIDGKQTSDLYINKEFFTKLSLK